MYRLGTHWSLFPKDKGYKQAWALPWATLMHHSFPYCFSVFFWIQKHMCIPGKILKVGISYMRFYVRKEMPSVRAIALVSYQIVSQPLRAQLVAIFA